MADALRERGHKAVHALTIAAADLAVRAAPPDVLVVGSVCSDSYICTLIRGWRTNGMRGLIIALGARRGVQERIAILDAGADVHLTKQVDIMELDAHVRALVRASERQSKPAADIVTVGSIEIDHQKHEVRRDGVKVTVFPREFRMLAVLADQAGQVVSRDSLLERVWGMRDDGESNLVEMHISRLRSKLSPEARESIIQTVRGRGYRLR